MMSQYTPKLISIIVPMYKVEKFIGKCLKSILNQTYKDIEIIAVNDCSPDNSLHIAQSLSKNDSRLKVVSLDSNHGVSFARFEGLQRSNGEYIMFVDGDDYLPRNSVSALYESVVSTKADVVEGGSARVLDSYGLIKKSKTQTALLLEHGELMDKYFISFFGVNILGVQLWAKLYSHKLLDETNAMAPTDYRMGEDLIANLKLFPYVKRYCRITIPVYNYRWGGVTSCYNSVLYDDLKRQYYSKVEYINRYRYYKAIRTAKIEMCNVLFSHLQQLIFYGYGLKYCRDFILAEYESGFIDEITDDVEYEKPYFNFLKTGKFEEVIRLASLQPKFKKLIMRMMSVIQKFIR